MPRARSRPRTFDAVVGQEHIVRTLRNAIELDKVHHAYLFVGSRGTGKTSMAKLLACALNAEGVARAPMQGGKRVYILDEAHMLTPAAWNAFLKTLEEPPSHVVFVLATTEAHKVPATIVDRCHRFDFHRPSLEQIAGVLERVAGSEGIDVPQAATQMIARAATGSFRDALGVADAELVFEATDALADHDAKAALLAVQRLSASGRDLTQFVRDLAAHLRHLFLVQAPGEGPDSF